jgi:hypothetical protein
MTRDAARRQAATTTRLHEIASEFNRFNQSVHIRLEGDKRFRWHRSMRLTRSI